MTIMPAMFTFAFTAETYLYRVVQAMMAQDQEEELQSLVAATAHTTPRHKKESKTNEAAQQQHRLMAWYQTILQDENSTIWRHIAMASSLGQLRVGAASDSVLGSRGLAVRGGLDLVWSIIRPAATLEIQRSTILLHNPVQRSTTVA
ncbi:hypothetical protein ACA910_007459 [Epithemia clementina (nom. ined.)]